MKQITPLILFSATLLLGPAMASAESVNYKTTATKPAVYNIPKKGTTTVTVYNYGPDSVSVLSGGTTPCPKLALGDKCTYKTSTPVQVAIYDAETFPKYAEGFFSY